jgi:hypothetical protein
VNPVFLVKLAPIGAGLANIAIYEFGVKRAVEACSGRADADGGEGRRCCRW